MSTPELRFEEKIYKPRAPTRKRWWHYPRHLFPRFHCDDSEFPLLDVDYQAPASLTVDEAHSITDEIGTFLRTDMHKHPVVRGKTGRKKTDIKPRVKRSLSMRLPREKAFLISPIGDGLTAFDRALVVLGARVRETKQCYMLDGKPCNATDIMRISGVEQRYIPVK